MRAILGLDDRNPAVSAMKFAIPGENGKQASIVLKVAVSPSKPYPLFDLFLLSG
jgi:hypothetical protein